MTERPDPVTLLIANTIKPGKEEEYRTWMAGISDAARQFEGYEGTQVMKPTRGGNRTVHALIRFRDHHTLSAWEESAVRLQWLDQLVDLVESSKAEKLEGIEFWFEPPNQKMLQKPPRYRMALVTLLAIYPQILFIPPLLSLILPESWPRYLTTMVSCVATVLLMTWVVMPAMTRIFSFWLFWRKKS